MAQLDEPLGPPYGPPANIRAVIAVWRARGLPAAVNREWLVRIGLSANLAPRNVHALRYLGLIDYADAPTGLAQRLATASAEDYPATLDRIVRTAYASVFAVRDPATDARARLEDAFRQERPAAQRSRMVACFLGLCSEAGIPVKDGRGKPPAPAVRVGRPRVAATAPAAPRAPANGALEALIAKFPDFDPAWPEGVQERWFAAFARLREDVLR